MRPQHENHLPLSLSTAGAMVALAAMVSIVMAVTVLFGANSASSAPSPANHTPANPSPAAAQVNFASAEAKKSTKASRAQAAAKRLKAKKARAVAMKRLAKKYPRTAAKKMMKNRGYSRSQRVCVINLWNKESNWRWWADNPSSSAYGIPQALPGSKMRSAGADWRTNPVTQIKWGLTYIKDRYGKPCGAWRHSQSRGWY